MKKKVVLFFVLALTFIYSVNASEPKKEWERSFKFDESASLNVFNDVAYNENSEYFAVGYYESKNMAPKSSSNGLLFSGMVVKYDKDGKLLWQKSYDSDEKDINFVGVEATSEGGCVAVGYYEVFRTMSYSSSSPYTSDNKANITRNIPMLVVKYDKDGNVVWNKNIELGDIVTSSNILSVFNRVFIDKSDNIYIIPNNRYMNIFKLDKDGNLVYSKELSEYNATDNQIDAIYLFDAREDKDDNIVVAGIRNNRNTQENTGSANAIIRKYDSAGDLMFDKEIVLDGYYASIMSIDFDSDGNYVAIVNSASLTDKTEEFMILKISPNGKVLDKQDISSIYSSDYLNETMLNIDKSNKYIINGYSNRVGKFFSLVDSITYKNNLEKFWSLQGDILGNVYNKFKLTNLNEYLYVGINNVEFFETNNVYAQIADYVSASAAYIVKYSADYNVKKEEEGKGTVTVDTDNAKVGDIVTIDAEPDRGYRIDKIIVTDSEGNNIEVVDGKFTMPASDVTVKVIFTNSILVNPKTGGIDLAGTLIFMIMLGLAGYEYMKSKQMLSL